ncbi:hypothetical protein NQ318_015488 [Aromia moschata]|uniref:C2H2-type domain-containing protein n=1 Tax=Aromia moschata TaxID=1265417 RepID=A0AAV8XHJ5_9CUCU|nr:hypothetical protein NQ318_015488 [Aromia moschata]
MTTQKACNLCLKVSNDIQVIDKITREILDVLLLKIDFSLNEDYLICERCSDSIYTFFEFKSMCLDSEDGISSFSGTLNGMEVDIVKMNEYLKENSGGISSSDDAICRLCLKRNRCVDLNMLNESSGEDITAKCIPEIDIDFARDPKICLSCQTTLVNFYRFATKCLVKQEDTVGCNDQETCLAIKSEELDIKTEEEDCDSNTNNSLSPSHSSVELSEVTQIQPFVDKTYNQQTNQTSTNSDPYKNGHEIKMENPKDHQLIEDVTVTRYHCYDCPYVTKQKGLLSRHVLIHRKSLEIRTYDCSLCPYKAKRKSRLTEHMLIHKDASEVTTYDCSFCSYKTKRKGNLTRHMLTHKDISEVTTYDCSFCPYKTNRRSSLPKHMLIHKDISEVTTYDCSFCPYKAKHKGNLLRHILIHKDASEVITYHCSLCSYKTIHKPQLTRHMLIHKDASELTTYDCSFCSYKTKWKRNLTTHMVIHKDASDGRTYQRAHCSFKAIRKKNLISQLLRHLGLFSLRLHNAYGFREGEFSNALPESIQAIKDE